MPPVPFLPSSFSYTQKGTDRARRFDLEGLEPRWLLSATPVAAALQAAVAFHEPEPLWQEPVQSAQLSMAATTLPAAVSLDLAQGHDSQGVVSGILATVSFDAARASVLLPSSLESSLGEARLQAVYGQARSAVQAFLGHIHGEDLQALFPGLGNDARVQLHTEAVRQDWLQGAGGVTLTLASSDQLGGAMAAFTARGPSGGAEVFVNRQWLNGVATDADLLRVLVEELGHGLDAALNGETDSPGDEGELFAAHVLALPLEPAQRQRIALEDDRAVLWWGMSSFVVEQANFSSNQNITGVQLAGDNTISGNVTLTSTYVNVANPSSNGSMYIGDQGGASFPVSFLDGDSDASQVADHLTIKATGVVRFYSAVGSIDPLESLTITASTATPTGLPSAVIFDHDVVLAGPLVIDTDGLVTFAGKLTITGGGLTIRGASEIRFNNTVNVNGGNILLEGDEIELLAGSTLKSTGGVLTMRTTTLNLGMEVGSPAGVASEKLDLSATELSLISAGGFSKIILGHLDTNTGHATVGQGAVRIGGFTGANQYTFQAPLEVYGNTITIEDIASAANPGLAIKGSVKLDATGNIDIRNRLLASTDLSQASALQNITLYSATGQVTQSNETNASLGDGQSSEPLQGAALLVDAITGIDLIATEVTTATLSNTGSGHIRLVETAAGGALTLLKAKLGNASNTAITSGMVSVQTLSSNDGDLTLTPAAVPDVSAPGSVSLRAGAALTLGANADLLRPDGADADTDLEVMTGTLDLQAGTAMVLTGRSLKAVGDIRVQAGTSLAIGKIQSSGHVALIAGGSITDGDADTVVDVSAVGLLMQAGAAGGVGTSADALETTVATLTGVTGSGGVFVEETDALVVDSVTVTVNRLSSTGIPGTEVSSQSDLRTTSGNGAIVLRSTAGSLTLNDGNADGVVVSSHGAGNVLLQTLGTGTDIAVNADVTSTNGNVSVRAAQALSFAADADVRTASTAAGNGSIDLEAGTGAITMNASSVLLSTGASATARLLAATSVTVGDITVATGSVSITATAGAIVDADALTGVANDTNDTDLDISAASLRVSAGTAIAASVNHLETAVGTLSAQAAGGGVFMLEADDLTVGSVAVSVNRVGSAAGVSTVTDAAQADVRTTGANGSIVLRSTAGSLTLNDGNADGVVVSSHGAGNVLLQTLGTGTDIAVNADVTSTNGNVSVRAAQALSFAADADVRTASTAAGNGSIDLEAGTGAITMNASSVLLSTGASATARLLAATSVTVGDITVATGSVSITATAGAIVDADALTGVANDTNDTDLDISAASLRVSAGTAIAASVNHLETAVGTLSAQAAGGGVFMLEADDLTVGSVAVSVNRVGSAAGVSTVTDAAQADVRTTGANGAIVLRSTAGNLTLNDGNSDGVAISANGSGHVLVQALNAGKSITVNADVATDTGNVSVLAGLDLILGANADLLITGATPGTASIDAEATAGALSMSASSTMSSSGTGATARLKAGTSVTVGDVSLAAGAVSITAGTSILDADALTGGTTNDTSQDVTAQSLRLSAGSVIADSVNHLETTVGTLTASSAGSVYLLEADDLTVGSVAVSVNRVGSAAGVSTVTDAAQADVRTTGANGAIVLRSTAGSLTLNDGNADGVVVSSHGAGNVLLQTLGTGTDIAVNADVTSTNGNVSVRAAQALSFAADADVRTASTAAGNGSIDLEAGTGAITMNASSVLLSTGASATARLLAATSVTVGDITVATGSVSITATAGAIVDADALTGVANDTNDTDLDISAASLRVSAGTAIAASVNHLETAVGTLSAQAAGGGVFMLEADDLTVGSVAVSVNRVGSAAGVSTVTDAAQADVRTTGANGAIVLRSTAGNLTLNDGNSDGVAISANGSGHVLVQALNAGKSITVNADVATDTGNVSVLAGLDLILGANADLLITGATPGTASIDAEATAGALSMSASSTMSSSGTGATARLKAGTSVTVGDVSLAAGAVSITAGTSILDADALTGGTTNDTSQDVTAQSLRLSAGSVIADSVNHLETTVGTLTASSAGSVYLLEADDLTVGSVAVSVNRVGSAAGVSTVTDAAQADVRTTGANGAIVLRSTAGSLTLNDGNADGVVVSSHGAGNVLLQTLGTGTDIAVNADVTSTNGNVSVRAAQALSFAADADVRTASTAAGNGSIDLEAGTGAITMNASSVLLSTGASATARLLAATSVTVGDITVATGSVSITATAGAIVDADALTGVANDTNDTDLDISAASLRVSAGTAIAASVNHLETAVGTLSAQAAGGGVFMLEADDLTVGSVAVSVNRVGSAAGVSTVTDAAQADVRTTGANGAIVLRSTAGNLTLNDGNSDGVAISANGSGHVLVQALNAGKSITVNADVATDTGNVSVLAGLDLILGANADLLITGATPGTASIDAEATAGALSMSASSTMSSSGTGATARLKAGTSVTVGDVSLAAGAVSITAGTSILDADALTGGTTNDTSQDVTAQSLRLSAGSVIADSVNHLETTVGTLTASSAGSVYLLEADDLTVGSVAVSVNRVGSAAGVSTVTDAAQADVRTTGANGSIVLRSTAGSLTLNDGNSDGVAISANGSGHVLLQSQGTGSDLTVNAAVQSGTGHVTLHAVDAMNVSANVRTSSAGTLSVSAGGALTQLGSTTLEATGSSLRLNAGQDLAVGNVVANQVSLVSTGGAVISATGSTKNVTATVLRIAADDAVGTSTRSLSTSVRTLSVDSLGSQSAGVFLTEDNGLTLGSVSVSVTEVTSTGAAATSATSDAAQSSVIARGDSDMRLQLLAGDLVSADANQSLKATRLLLQIDAGSAGANTLQKQNLLGSAIDTKANAAVDNMAELQQLADAVSAVLAAVVGGTGPSVQQLHALGVTGVTPHNLAAVHRALQATAEDGSGADSLSELQALVTQAQLVKPPVSLTQLAAIMQAAEDNNATEGKPSLTDYSQAAGAGNAGVLRVTSANIASINSALNTTGVGRAQVDTVAKVQAVVDAYAKVLNAADAVDNDTLKPLLADYAALGITGVESALKVSLLGDVIDITARIHADTAAELQVLADAVSAALAGVVAANPSPNLAQLQALGLTGLSPDNLAAVQLAIRNTSDDGLGADTLPELQALVTALSPLSTSIWRAAQDNSATEVNPSLATYTEASVTGVTSANLVAINSVLNSASVGATEVDTAAEVQALVNAYRAVLSTADGAASAATKPTRAQYELLGVSGLSAPVVALDVGTLALRVQPTGTGSAFLSNVGALNVSTVLGVAGAQVGGDWVLTSGTSVTSLNVQANVSAGGALRLESRGSLGIQADVQAQGSLTMLAAGPLVTAVGADVLTLTGDVNLYAAAAMDLAGDVSSTLGSAWVQAGTDLTFETLNAASGKVVLQAGNAILGKSAAVDVRADVLLVMAGVGAGSAANPLRVSVSELSVLAGADGASLVHKDEGVRVSGLTVASLRNQNFQVVGANALLSNMVRSQSGITVTGGGSLVLTADSDLAVSAPVDVGQDISLTAKDITLSDTTVARSGDITATADPVDGAINVANTTTAGDDITASASLISVAAATTAGDDIILEGDFISVGAAAVAGGDQSLRAISSLNVSSLGRLQSGSAATVYMGVSAGSMTLSAGSVLNSGSGGASLTASQDVNMRGDIQAAGSLDALAGRDIGMSTGAGAGRSQGNITATGNVWMEAGRVLALGSVDASTASVALKAGTSVSDGDNDDVSPQVDVRALAVSVQSGTDTGTALDRIDLAADTLALLTTSGSAFLNESNGLSVSAFTVPVQRILPNGSVQSHPNTSAVFDGLVLQGNLVLAQAAGDMTLGGQGLQASGTAELRVAGAVLDGDLSGDTVDITASILNIFASNVGSAASTLETSLGTLSGNVGAGGLYIQESDALLVSNLSSTGAVNLTTTATGSDLSVASLSAAGQTVTLNSQGAVLDGDSDNDGLDITAAALTVTASGLGTAASRIETSLDSLTASVGTGGAHLTETDALLVSNLSSTGAVNLTTTATGSDLSVASLSAAGQTVTLNSQGAVLDGDSDNDGLDITAAALTVTASGLGTAASRIETSLDSLTASVGTGGAHLTETDALLVSNLSSTGAVNLTTTATGSDLSVASLSAAGQTVTLNSQGAVLDGDSDNDGLDITAAALTVTASGLGTAASRIETSLDSLTASVGTGGAHLTETDALLVSNLSSTGAVNLTTTATGSDLSVASLSAAGQTVTLNSQGAVLDGDSDNDGLDITAAALTVTASGLGTAASRIETSLDSLTASVGTGGAHLTETDALLVSNLSSTGAVNLTTTATGSDLSVASLSAAGQTVTLNSQGAVLDGDSDNDGLDITAAALTVTASGLGTAASRIETSLDSLTASVGTGGAHLTETDALLVSNLSSTGAVNLTTTATGSDLSVASLSAAGQTVTLNSQGAVLDGDSDNDGLDITAAALTVTASGLGTAASRIETSLDSLTASVGTGGAHLTETDALLVSNLSSTGAVNLTTTATGSDLSVASLSAAGQTVTLNSQGAVLDGDTDSNAVNITARGLNVTAAGLGNVAHPLNTSVDSVGGELGVGGLNLDNRADLLVKDLTSRGAVVLSSGGNLSVAAFNATGQSVNLSVTGGVLDGNSGSDGVELNAGMLTLQATGLGSQDNPLKTNIDSLTATMGSGGVFLKDADAVEVLAISGSGPLNMQAPVGAFEVKRDLVLSSPLVLQSEDIQISAEMSGPRLDLITPTLEGALEPMPLVLGSLVANVTPDNGVHISVQEAALLSFDTIVLGSSQAGQAIWFQTTPDDASDRLTFRSPVEVETLGNTRFSGLVTGTGLQVRGPGHTTYLDDADILQTHDVVINDRVVVTKTSLMEVIGGKLSLNGGLTVERGQTLTLLAEEIEFGPFEAGRDVIIVLEEGATLVLGATSFTWDSDVKFDSNGGHVVLRGAPDTDQLQSRDRLPDTAPMAFAPRAEDLAVWIDWLAADQDGDAGLRSLILGDEAASTRIPSAYPWTDLGAESVILRGSAVHLGSAGEAAWTLTESAVMRATAGSLDLHVDLEAMGDVSLVSTTGHVHMDTEVKVAANGAVALSAATGMVVGHIDSAQRVDLDSHNTNGPQGRIVSATAAAAGTAHVTAPAVSVYGYGQNWSTAEIAQMLTVKAQAVQVSAPSGLASRGLTTGGTVYRLMDQGAGYLQFKLIGDSPERVMVSTSQVQTERTSIREGVTPAQAWQPAGQPTGLAAWVPTAAVSRYLLSQPELMSVAPTSFMAASSDDLLSDMAYGLAPEDNTVVLSLGLDAPLVRSTGQLLTESDWTFLPQ